METDCEIHWLEGEVPPYANDFRRFLAWVWETLGVERVSVGVVFCTEGTMAAYNRQFRGREEPTDVLSFSASEAPTRGALEGDILICPGYAETSARLLGVDPLEELFRVTLHGHLHLAGWDHATNQDSEPMLVRQEELLKEWNLGRRS